MKARRDRRAAHSKQRRALLKYRGDRCSKCGRTVDSITALHGDRAASVFQFNHIDSKRKHKNYKRLMENPLPREIVDEVDKCHVMCTFCHDLLTLQNITGRAEVTVTVAGKTITKEGALQAIVTLDPATKDASGMHFFSDVNIDLEEYRVAFGDRAPRIMTGDEARSLLVSYFLATKPGDELTIGSNRDGAHLMTARRLDEEHVRVQSIARCVLLEKVDLTSEEGEVFHISNGKVITSKGRVIQSLCYRATMPYGQWEGKDLPPLPE